MGAATGGGEGRGGRQTMLLHISLLALSTGGGLQLLRLLVPELRAEEEAEEGGGDGGRTWRSGRGRGRGRGRRPLLFVSPGRLIVSSALGGSRRRCQMGAMKRTLFEIVILRNHVNR